MAQSGAVEPSQGNRGMRFTAFCAGGTPICAVVEKVFCVFTQKHSDNDTVLVKPQIFASF